MKSAAHKILDQITEHFNAAAPRYDRNASVQAQVAAHLVGWASPLAAPREILDIGSGTGFVAQIAAQNWPTARITALDQAPAMLQEAQRKVARLNIAFGDATQMDFGQQFDMIFSSMMLHWLPQPLETLKRWQSWLKPDGHLYVALLADGSFQEWHTHCRSMSVKDGLWPMPSANFADDFAFRCKRQTMAVTYSSARDFLHRLKSTGAATPRPDHRPLGTAIMRRLLEKAPQPFMATYHLLYMEIPSPLLPRNST